MAWLVRVGEVLASLEVADTRAARRKGLLGRDGIEGALLLTPARSVHTLGMRFDIDVAFLDRDGVVKRTCADAAASPGVAELVGDVSDRGRSRALPRWNLSVGQVVEVVP